MTANKCIKKKRYCISACCDVWHFKQYLVVNDSDGIMIVGSDSETIPNLKKSTKQSQFYPNLERKIAQTISPIRNAKGTCEINKAYDNYSLLVSLLTLHESLSSKNPRADEFSPDEIKADINAIIDWCYNNGLPCENTLFSKAASVWDKYRVIGFYYWDFRKELFDLYTAYLLWLRVFRKDITEDNFFHDVSKDQCISMLGDVFAERNSIELPVCDSIPFSYITKCENQLHVGYEQMFSMCLDIDCIGMDKCRHCKKPYEKYDRRQEQCSNCRKLSYQRTRGRKAIENGK